MSVLHDAVVVLPRRLQTALAVQLSQACLLVQCEHWDCAVGKETAVLVCILS